MAQDMDLIEQLHSEDPAVVREAAFNAGRLKIGEAVPHLTALIESRNLGIQEAAEFALRKIRGPQAVAALCPLLRSDEAPVRNMAMDILREIGVDDLSALKTLLRDEDPDLRIFIADILGSTGTVLAVAPLCEALLHDPEENVRHQAAMSLGNLGFPAAVDSLNIALHDEEWVQFAAVEALTKIHAESSMHALVKGLSNASELVAFMIVEALGELGNIKAVPLLLKRLDSSSVPMRNKIVQAIIKILGGKSLQLFLGKDKDRFRGYLMDALADEDTEVQDAAVRGLAAIGDCSASEGILRLAEQLNPDTDTERLLLMIDALVAIGLTPSLQQELFSTEEYPALLAVEVMGRIKGREVAELFKKAFPSQIRNVQRSIAGGLAAFGTEEDRDFFLAVLKEQSDGDLLKSALYFLSAEVPSPECSSAVLPFLEHRYPDVRKAALEACILLKTPEILEKFKQMFQDDDPQKRTVAVKGLLSVDPEGNMDCLGRALADESPNVRRIALESLSALKDIPESIKPSIMACLHDENSEVRLALIQFLGDVGGNKPVPYLQSALSDPDDWVKIRAVEALGRLKGEEALPQLVGLLDDSNPLVAIKVIEALGDMGGDAAFQALLQVMENGNPDLQQAAEDAAGRIQATLGGENV